jgi:hypothetical protein
MLTHDLSVSVTRPHTSSGVPEVGGGPPPPDGVILSEAGDLLLVEAGQFLAFD